MPSSAACSLTRSDVRRRSASFVRQDTTTQGNWIGTYGSQGYDVIGNAASLPSYATVTPTGTLDRHTWAASTTDPRALEDAGGSGTHRRLLVLAVPASRSTWT